MEAKKFLSSILLPNDIIYVRGKAKIRSLREQLGITQQIVDLLIYEPSGKIWKTIIQDFLDSERSENILCPLRFHKNNPSCSHTKALASRLFIQNWNQDEQMS